MRGFAQVFLEAKHLGFEVVFQANKVLFPGLVSLTDALEQHDTIRTKQTRSIQIQQWNPDGSLNTCEWKEYQRINISTNVFPTGVVGCDQKERIDMHNSFFKRCNASSVVGCIWWYCFTIASRLEHAILIELKDFKKWKEARGREKLKVIAVHVRVGDVMSGYIQKDKVPVGPSLDILATKCTKCAVRTAESMGFVNAAILLVSDSQIIKTRFRSIAHGRVWTPGTQSGHIEKSTQSLSGADLYFGALVDIFLLSLSDALIKSESGFSNLSHGLGMYPPDRVSTFASCGLNTRSGGL